MILMLSRICCGAMTIRLDPIPTTAMFSTYILMPSNRALTAMPASNITSPIDRCFQHAQAMDDDIEIGRLADEHAGTDHALEIIA